MNKKKITVLFIFVLFLSAVFYSFACSSSKDAVITRKDTLQIATRETSINYAGENHLKNITQLTDGGENAEAYFSFGKKLSFQSTRRPYKAIRYSQ